MFCSVFVVILFGLVFGFSVVFLLHVRTDMFHLAECIVVEQEQEAEEMKEKGRKRRRRKGPLLAGLPCDRGKYEGL